MEGLDIIPYNPGAHETAITAMMQGDTYYHENFCELAGECPENASVALVHGEVAGVLCYSQLARAVDTLVYVAPAHRRRGIGAALMRQADAVFQQTEVVERSTGDFLFADSEARQFLYKHGYYISYSSYLMERTGPPLPVMTTTVRQYEDADYLTWHRLSGMAFYQMRESVNLWPSFYAPPSEAERQRYLAESENRYVLLLAGEIAAVGIINGDELAIVAVRPDLQGKGYGRAFVSHLVNTIHGRGVDTVKLWVVKGNPAKHLYEKLGFREKALYGFVTRYYRPDSRMSAPPDADRDFFLDES